MFFQIVSDIHLERADYNCLEDILSPCADNLILAGDIGNPLHPNLDIFLAQVSKAFKTVIYIAGNHEFYNTQGYSMMQMMTKIRDIASRLSFSKIRLIKSITFALLVLLCGVIVPNIFNIL